MAYPEKNICQLKIGKIHLDLVCPTPDYAESVREYFMVRDKPLEPSLVLKLDFIMKELTGEIPESLFFNKKSICAKNGVS